MWHTRSTSANRCSIEIFIAGSTSRRQDDGPAQYRNVPPTIFPGLRHRIEDLIAAGRLHAPKTVYDEIRPGDECYVWAKSQTELFVEESLSVQRIVKHLMATHGNTEKPHKGISGADPFVIAMAKNGGAHWTVVTDELPESRENRKIPLCASKRWSPTSRFKG
jgi:Domain of unknown function (DUF4411)